MPAVFIVAVVFGSIVLAIAVICGTILMAIKLRQGGVTRKDQKTETEEARMIQEIYHGLSRMESRVEALETILMDRKGKDRHNETI
jgi:phage shock protein B